MANPNAFPPEIPMSVRAQRALDAVRRKPMAYRIRLLVKAGLMTEAECEAAIARLPQDEGSGRKPKARRTASEKKGATPGKS